MSSTPTKTVYKIRRESDGQFSMGGFDPRFSKKGKIWNGTGPLTNHLGIVRRSGHVYAGCVVVTFELVETEVSTMPVAVHLGKIAGKRAHEAAVAKKARDEHNERSERQKARNLIAKYGPNP